MQFCMVIYQIPVIHFLGVPHGLALDPSLLFFFVYDLHRSIRVTFFHVVDESLINISNPIFTYDTNFGYRKDSNLF